MNYTEYYEAKNTVYFNSKQKAIFYHYYHPESPMQPQFLIKKSAFGEKYELKSLDGNTIQVFSTHEEALLAI
jgi:hypothetical protein